MGIPLIANGAEKIRGRWLRGKYHICPKSGGVSVKYKYLSRIASPKAKMAK
jgi:hypothetical protein